MAPRALNATVCPGYLGAGAFPIDTVLTYFGLVLVSVRVVFLLAPYG
jgi:hypothetical protein